MQAYKFETKISKQGTIKVPLYLHLTDKNVEVIILPKPEYKSVSNAASEFVDKWAGFLSDTDIDDAKYKYLTGKYL